jgi:DNA modification methylase
MLRDIIEQNEEVKVNSREVQMLKEHFGGCFNNEGKFDLEKFRTLIGGEINIVEENQGFNFLGKSYARMITGQESLTVIRPDNEHNSKPENRDSENIYISGDNLDALKHLCKSYSKQVKCIYIDPPYNTGSDGFVYNDKFDFKAEELSSKLGINLEQAEHIIDMKKSSSASDAAWLTFMLPRLELAKDMLSKDGVIFISIDDNEQANLKLLCDEIFGVENFLANLTRRTKSGGGSAADAFAVENDYILAYARDAEQLGSLYIPYTEEYLKRYKEEDEIGKFFWDTMSRSCTGTKPYQIEAPDGTMLDGNWFKSETTYLKDKDAGDTRIIKKPDGTWSVQFKQRIAEGKKLRSILIEEFIRKDLLGNEFKSTQEDLEKLGMEGLFSNPKTVFLLNYLLQLISGDNNYIMDFFSGSATTAEAVLQSNIALTKKNRFIMIQLPEDLDESVQRTSGATKETIERDINFLEENHYPHTLDFIGFERIKRAAKQIAEANPLFKGDLGFKHYTLESFEPDTIDRLYDFDMNANMNDNDILSKFGAQTVLTTWLCRDGYGLNPKVTEVKLKDYTAYLCGKHLYLLDADFYQEEMAELIDKMADTTQQFNPDVIVVFGYGMGYNTRLMLDKNLRALADARGNKITLDVRY